MEGPFRRLAGEAEAGRGLVRSNRQRGGGPMQLKHSRKMDAYPCGLEGQDQGWSPKKGPGTAASSPMWTRFAS